jgi:hypothetical protein
LSPPSLNPAYGDRGSARLAASAQRVYSSLSAADNLETLVIDLETGLRGFVITARRFLEPWEATRAISLLGARGFTDDADQESRATSPAGRSYRRLSVPLVNTARQNLASAPELATTEGGKSSGRVAGRTSRFTEDDVNSSPPARALSMRTRGGQSPRDGSALLGSIRVDPFSSDLLQARDRPVRHGGGRRSAGRGDLSGLDARDRRRRSR